MKSSRNDPQGFSLVEILMVIAVLAALAAIAIPQYHSYIERGRAASCLSNRHNIDKDEKAFYIANGRESLAIDTRYVCPSGGVYVWLVSDASIAEYPRIGCSVHYGSQPAAETVLFSSDLSTMNGLRPLSGNWAIQNGTLAPVGNAEHRLAFGEASWNDYEIRMNAVISRGNGYGVYYRADGNPNISGYIFQYDPGLGNRFVVRKVLGGVEQAPFQTVSMPQGFPVYNQAHDISISIQGDRNVIKVDGRTVLDFKDSTFSSGMGGLRSWGNSKVNFDDLQVVQP